MWVIFDLSLSLPQTMDSYTQYIFDYVNWRANRCQAVAKMEHDINRFPLERKNVIVLEINFFLSCMTRVNIMS